MIYKATLYLILAVIFFGCQQERKEEKAAAGENFKVTGWLGGLKDPYIYLSYTVNDSVYKDSIQVKNESFAFSGHVKEPVMATLHTKNYKKRARFFMENEAIQIDGHIDSLDRIEVSGSSVQDEYEAYQELKKGITDKRNALYAGYRSAKKAKDSASIEIMEAAFDSLYKENKTLTEQYIKAHPDSYVSLYELRGLSYGLDYTEYKLLYDGLDQDVRQSAAGKKIAEDLSILNKTAVGKQAPGFTQNDVSGEPVSLEDFRGQYVLIDFWASWCGPCRAENPNVVKAYNEYKDNGFTILGISLDDKAEDWKKAIKKDGLTWTHVSDLKGWKNEVARQYGIRAVPTNYLIGPNGIILAKNLRGDALTAKLEEILSGKGKNQRGLTL